VVDGGMFTQDILVLLFVKMKLFDWKSLITPAPVRWLSKKERNLETKKQHTRSYLCVEEIHCIIIKFFLSSKGVRVVVLGVKCCCCS
jgi:hypothetical protein